MAKQSQALVIVLVTIGGLAILGCIAFFLLVFGFMFTSFSSMANDKTAWTRVAMLDVELALTEYQLDLGEYPTSEQGLDALLVCPRDLEDPSLWQGPYVRDGIPNDAWENPFQYRRADAESWTVISAGGDGLFDTEDDLTFKPFQ